MAAAINDCIVANTTTAKGKKKAIIHVIIIESFSERKNNRLNQMVMHVNFQFRYESDFYPCAVWYLREKSDPAMVLGV